MARSVRLSFGLIVIISSKGGKGPFYASIGALVINIIW